MIGLLIIIILLISNFTFAQVRKYNKPPKYHTNTHWFTKRNTASGKHSYYKPCYGHRNTCTTYKMPYLKQATYRKLYYWRPSRSI